MTDQLRNPSSSSSSSSSPSSPSLSSAPSLCVNRCGFYGNPKQDNLCSKCYKTIAANKQLQAHAAQHLDALNTSTQPADSASLPLPSSPAASALSSLPSPPSPLAIPQLTHSRHLTDEASPTASTVAVDSQTAEPALSSFSSSLPSSSAPVLSFSESLTIPLTSPQPSPTLSATPDSPVLPLADLSLASSPFTAPALPSPAPVAVGLPVSASASEGGKKRKNRCSHCSKLVGLTYFACRCNDDAMFCSAHRYPHSHHCTFDHKAQQQTKLIKNNPLCAHEKLEKI